MLKELRTQHRTIVQMSFNGFKNNEIAEKLGMAPATISGILRSPLGKAYLKGLIDRSQEDTLDVRKKLISLNKDALGTISRILDPKQKAPFNVQLTAAKDVLDRNGYKPTDKFEVDVYSHKSDTEIENEIRAMEAAVARSQIIQANQSDAISESSQPDEDLASLPVSAEPQDADAAASINQPAATASQIPADNTLDASSQITPDSSDDASSNSAPDTAMTIHAKNKPSSQRQMGTVPPEDDFTASDLPADIQAKLEDLSFDPFQNIEADC